MALSDSEEKRLQNIEAGLSNHARAIRNLAAKKQLTHVSTVLQKELNELRAQLESLQSQLDALKQ
jgi:hypothetical protein